MYIYLENNMKACMYKNVQSMFQMRIANNFSISYLFRFSVLYDKYHLYKTMLFKNMS